MSATTESITETARPSWTPASPPNAGPRAAPRPGRSSPPATPGPRPPALGLGSRQRGLARLHTHGRPGHDPESAGASGASRRCQTRARRSWLLTTPPGSARCSPATGSTPVSPLAVSEQTTVRIETFYTPANKAAAVLNRLVPRRKFRSVVDGLRSVVDGLLWRLCTLAEQRVP